VQQLVLILPTLVGGLIAAAAGLLASWATHRWSLRERSAERAEIRRAALSDQRAADLRELGTMLPELLAAAQEIIWERVSSQKPMPRSDPRTMRLTNLGQKSRFLRVVLGDEELGQLVRRVWSTTERLADSSQENMDRDMHAANQAVAAALDKVAELLRPVVTAPEDTQPKSRFRRQEWRGLLTPPADPPAGNA
jgi:hypothetical protein